MGIEPIPGTEWDQNPFKSTHDSDCLSHTNDLDKLPLQELLYVLKVLKKFYLKHPCNIFLLTVDQRMYHVARQGTWEPLSTTGSGQPQGGCTSI